MDRELPRFPTFEKLSIDHKELVQAIVNNFPTSDFNFAGLFTWDTADVVKISGLNGNLVIQSADYLTHEKFYSFIGDNEVDKTIDGILKFASKEGDQTNLKLITETVAKNISDKLFNIYEDRDNFDYVYHTTDLTDLPGKKNQKERQKLHRFTRKHGDNVTEKEIDLNNDQDRESIEEIIKNWGISRAREDKDVKNELMAIRKALDHHKTLSLKAFGVYDKDKLIAFTVFEILPHKMAIAHFDKADTQYEDVYVHMKHRLAKHLTTLDVERVNYEQDLGLEGLRRSKESFHPHTFIKKYTVSRKT